MKTGIELLITKQKLTTEEIYELMIYALELLKEFESHTKASIARIM